MKHFLRVMRYFRLDQAQVVLAFVFLVLSAGAGVLKPWPLALLIDSLTGSQPVPKWLLNFVPATEQSVLILTLSSFIFILHGAQAALSAAQNFITIRVGLRGLARVRTAVFHWLQRVSLRFQLGASQGDLIYRMSWDTYAFQTLFQQGLFTTASASLALVFMLIIMCQVNLELTLVSLAIVPGLVLAIAVFGREMKRRSLAAHQADSGVTSLIQQNLLALPLIQSYTGEAREEKRFHEQTGRALDVRTKQHGCEVLYGFVVALTFAAGTTLLTAWGGRLVWKQELTLGELLIFVTYLAQLYEPLNQLTHARTTLADANAGTQRIFELLDEPSEVPVSENARPVVHTAQRTPPARTAVVARGNLAFEHVSFAYESGRGVLHDITFELKAGGSLAILGPSGAGKSTLLHLAPRFYDPTAGAVRLEGVNLKELNLSDLRAHISVVFQQPILLPGSVAENIAYGRPDASAHEIEAAARAAHAHSFIARLPHGYATALGEGGARLSIGEVQRVNIARAFLKDAPILVLDEPTSALDPENEALVVASLKELMKNRTTLIVSHRLWSIQQFDHLLVLEAGRVTFFGAPSEAGPALRVQPHPDEGRG